jgi:tRNA(fMet)-specific endonuclease VapC
VIACLDTNVLVDVLSGRHPLARGRYEHACGAGQALVVSALSAHELIFGALISGRPEFHMAQAREFLANHEVIDWSVADAYSAARLRTRLRSEGRTIGTFDCLIAGQALNRGWTLVTANAHEFIRVEGLQIEDWTR